MITTSELIVLLVTLSSFFPVTAVMGQQTVPPATPPTATPPIPADYIQYQSPVFSVVVSYPPDWDLRPPYNSPRGYSLLQVFAPVEGEEGFTGSRPNVNVEVSEERGIFNPKEKLEQRAFEIMPATEDFQIIESVPTTLTGLPAHQIQYSFKSGIDGSENRHMQIIAQINARAYLITYASPADLFDEYLPAVQNMINSFRVEPTAPTLSPPTAPPTPTPPAPATPSPSPAPNLVL
jgi:Probable lipoprotein LpqN